MSLWALTWPMFIELVLAFTLGLEDSFYLARISDHAAGAVGSLLPVFGICNMVFQSFAQSGASVASQLLGGGHPERARRTFLTMLVLNGAPGTVDGRVDPLPRPPAGGRLDGALGRDLHSTPPTSWASSAPCSSSRPSASPTRPSSTPGARRASTCWRRIFVNVANISLNHLLTMGTWGLPRLGVKGVAWSTIVAQLLGLLVAATVVHFRLRIRWEKGLSLAAAPPLPRPHPPNRPSVGGGARFVPAQPARPRGHRRLHRRRGPRRAHLHAQPHRLLHRLVLRPRPRAPRSRWPTSSVHAASTKPSAQLLRSLKLGMILGFAVMVVLAASGPAALRHLHQRPGHPRPGADPACFSASSSSPAARATWSWAGPFEVLAMLASPPSSAWPSPGASPSPWRGFSPRDSVSVWLASGSP